MKTNVLEFTKALSDPTRLKILTFLKVKCCVGDLWEKLNLPQNLVSHHLRVLRELELVTAEKKGLRVVYCLNHVVLTKNLLALNKFLGVNNCYEK